MTGYRISEVINRLVGDIRHDQAALGALAASYLVALYFIWRGMIAEMQRAVAWVRARKTRLGRAERARRRDHARVVAWLHHGCPGAEIARAAERIWELPAVQPARPRAGDPR